MLRFAREIVCVAVHGLLMVLTYYAFCYNLSKGNKRRAIFYLALYLIESYAVYLHIAEAFKEVRHES